jgi:hypothetical protein
MKHRWNLIALALLLVLVAACAPGPNSLARTPNEEGKIGGFWQGLWHGIIAPVTFIISLFSNGVHMYEIHNNGGWYNFGFLLGLCIIFGSGGGGAAAKRR